MREENIYTNRPSNLKINPKYYPLIWIVAIVCAFFSGIYSTIVTFSQSENIALSIYSMLIDIAVGGGVSALLVWFVALLLYNMGAKRGLRAPSAIWSAMMCCAAWQSVYWAYSATPTSLPATAVTNSWYS